MSKKVNEVILMIRQNTYDASRVIKSCTKNEQLQNCVGWLRNLIHKWCSWQNQIADPHDQYRVNCNILASTKCLRRVIEETGERINGGDE